MNTNSSPKKDISKTLHQWTKPEGRTPSPRSDNIFMKKACFFNGSGVSDAPAMLGLLGNIYLNFLNAKIAFGPEEPAFVISFLQNSTHSCLSLLQFWVFCKWNLYIWTSNLQTFSISCFHPISGRWLLLISKCHFSCMYRWTLLDIEKPRASIMPLCSKPGWHTPTVRFAGNSQWQLLAIFC